MGDFLRNIRAFILREGVGREKRIENSYENDLNYP
jgi:hypothetical protein